jgi:hypothetical protein
VDFFADLKWGGEDRRWVDRLDSGNGSSIIFFWTSNCSAEVRTQSSGLEIVRLS